MILLHQNCLCIIIINNLQKLYNHNWLHNFLQKPSLRNYNRTCYNHYIKAERPVFHYDHTVYRRKTRYCKDNCQISKNRDSGKSLFLSEISESLYYWVFRSSIIFFLSAVLPSRHELGLFPQLLPIIIRLIYIKSY